MDDALAVEVVHGATVLEHHVDLALLLVVEHVDELHDVLAAESAKEANHALHILLALRDLPQFPLLHKFNSTTTQSLRVNGFLNFSISQACQIP